MKASSALACAIALALAWGSAAVASEDASVANQAAMGAANSEPASSAEPKLKWKPYRLQPEPAKLSEIKDDAETPTGAKADPAAKQAGTADGKCDGKVEQCAAQTKLSNPEAKSRLTKAAKAKPTLARPTLAKNQPTLAKATVSAKSSKSGVVRAAMQDDDDALVDPFGDKPSRPGRREIDDNLEESTATPDENETTTMPDETESPDLTPTTPRTTRPPRQLDANDAGSDSRELVNPDGVPTTADVSCEQDKEVCKQDFLALKANVISRIDLDISIAGVEGKEFPCECSPSGLSTFEPRNWSKTVYTWKASGLCHKPLYFEDVHLERYGHSWNPVVQPFLSGAHFFVTVPLLPYKMGMNPPSECMYTLGYYRPGNCAPYLIDPIPLSLRGGIYEAAAITGAFYIFP